MLLLFLFNLSFIICMYVRNNWHFKLFDKFLSVNCEKNKRMHVLYSYFIKLLPRLLLFVCTYLHIFNVPNYINNLNFNCEFNITMYTGCFPMLLIIIYLCWAGRTILQRMQIDLKICHTHNCK